MAGVLIIGAIAILLIGLAVGLLAGNILMGRADRRAKLIAWVRGLRAGNRAGNTAQPPGHR
jgi:hypothetical protein